MYYNRRKEIIKNAIYITLILLLAIISTHYIYNEFQDTRSVDFNSESLDVTYHEATGDKLSITKITPVTDSVGLSSKSYNLTIKNNLTEKVGFKLKVTEDLEKITEDDCLEKSISKGNIRISIKNGNKENKIYMLLDYTEKPRNIADPWYSGDFYSAYYDIVYGCEKFLEYIDRRKMKKH